MKSLTALFLKISYTCMYVYHIEPGAQRSEGIGILWNWSYRATMWVLETNRSPLQEQHMFLATEPSL